MNDFKTSGCKPSDTSYSPYVWNIESDGGLRFTDSDSIAKSCRVVLDCEDVTFRLKELEINLDAKKTKEYLDNIGALVINGVKFVKLESERVRE